MATRWNPPDGFLVAIGVTFSQPQLWRVPASGAAQLIGIYPALPANISQSQEGKLDRTGRLFEIARDTSVTFRDVIVRRTIGGTSDVVYTEATNPMVKLHISGLVTGP
jgi:hypothetical protein